MVFKIHQSIYDRLKSQHLAIKEIIQPLKEDRLTLSPAPGKWNIHDNIAHLAKYQPVFLERLYNILLYDGMSFDRYLADDDPGFETWRSWKTSQLLDKLYVDREMIFQFVVNLDDHQLSHIGIHKKFGKLAIPAWTEFFLLHEAHHIFTIFKIANDTELY